MQPVMQPRRTYNGPLTDSARWDAFVPRDGDIVVCTPPKSGTTWTQAILALLISGDPEVDAQTSMKSPWIDINIRDVSEVMARLAAQDHRRQVKTHTPFDGLPYWSQLRYITVYRHPIDLYFSFRKHAQNQKNTRDTGYYPEAFYDEDPAPGFAIYVDSDAMVGASLRYIVTHYRETLAMGDRENLLRLHYADMSRDLATQVGRIAAHVGIQHPPDLMAQLVRAATFDNMKENAHRFTPSAGQGFWHQDQGFFDSATSNKWHGVLDDRALAHYDARMKDWLDESDRGWLEWGGSGPADKR